MATYCIYVQLFAYFALPLITLGDLAFRCPSCTAERVAACPKVTPSCEIVRELGCGCCPVCAKREGELCGVYTPRCSSGLRCYPRAEAELPLQELLDGFGHCGQKVDVDITSLDDLSTNEVHGTENPLAKRPSDARMWQESAMKQYQNKLKTKMKTNQFEDSRLQTVPQTPCQQELNEVLEEISRMTSEDNRGPLENLYRLKFPNCDKHGLYSLKQCNMSTQGQRGECWCVNPYTGVQIPETPKVRGDPDCHQYHEETLAMPTPAMFYSPVDPSGTL
ncbi:insulin-like growth factor-binding protein 2-B [Takifugu rubripes]|uniref:Insulin-like growth factor binding protein 2b n=1 Tax=Takifugu rubripes TaxID=31033 RepID=H2S9E1_TAKRU|nr:insulin-like growth factor-binding protein 2-B [Takifugu rubripes]